MTAPRKPPKLLRDCQPGDIVYVSRNGIREKVLVTGNNMGRSESYRLVRLIDGEVAADRPVPMSSSLLVVEVVKLYYAQQL